MHGRVTCPSGMIPSSSAPRTCLNLPPHLHLSASTPPPSTSADVADVAAEPGRIIVQLHVMSPT